ncbi:zinc ribbon domain-containing protein [Promicromonospora iranensis]|uniref:Nucleic acid-binding Zn-ribbon protein n=1 Tax=Promicromonospora iranensis TaxID=1105144 RepID=A0ABU2CUI6_9MICO|nr:C4-type zinc ribbon domain-containing protein [Promicromonospora iranensis]MDR7384812.1 putative nucleic acid-binding Zn-ribbon protein [Promicromonospora iranensis]
MATAPPEDQRRLLDVQALDTRVQQLAHQRKNLPALTRLTELDARIADLRASLVESRTRVADLRRELTKAESDVEQVRNRADRDQKRLESGGVSAKDAVALTDEIGSLATRQAALEEIELDVMERLEAHEDTLTKVEAANDELAAEKAKVEAERDAGWAEIDAQVQEIAGERAKAVDGLDTALVKLYEKIRAQLGGTGAAVLNGNRCEGCRMDLPPADLATIRSAAPDAVVRCEECGRILVRVAGAKTGAAAG